MGMRTWLLKRFVGLVAILLVVATMGWLTIVDDGGAGASRFTMNADPQQAGDGGRSMVSEMSREPLLGPIVVLPDRFDISPPMRDIDAPPQHADWRPEAEVPLPSVEYAREDASVDDFAEVLQDWPGSIDALGAPILNVDVLSNLSGYYPPDVEGDVGPNYYVEYINVDWAVYDKSGNIVSGWPKSGNSFWSGFGGVCESENDGDPIVIYDHLADRWMVSQFAVPNPFYQCIAVSTSPDPTGTWYRYAYQWPNNKFNDYPHFGLWPDGYYLTVNQFNSSGTSWEGAGVAALERTEMLVGNPAAQMIYFDLAGVSLNYGGQLPADLEGDPPPAGTPNYILEWDEAGVFGGSDAVGIWEFHVDWVTPANSTLGTGSPGGPNLVINTADVDTDICGAYRERCIPQLSSCTGVLLEAISDRLMWRVQYRDFGTHQTMVANHTVDVGSGRAGIHWFELRDEGGGWGLEQQGVYGPADGLHRWMGSIAMDPAGNIAMGYSVSSNSTYPSIRYVGRLASDPLGTMPQTEQTIVNGTGCQTGSGARWGDYSSISMDTGQEACTFWYIQEYLITTGGAPWQTRLATFKFDECVLAPDFSIEVTPASLNICVPDDAVYNVGVESLNNYNDWVTLSTVGAPGSSSFSPNPVRPPAGGTANSTLTISGAGVGSYTFDVQGDDGFTNHVDTVDLNVYAAAPTAATLLTPADGSTGVSDPPTFDWGDVADAAAYEIEIATDPDFGTIVDSATGLTASDYTPGGALGAGDTVYYWRVRAVNGCGSADSTIWAFRTAAPPACNDPILNGDFEAGSNGDWTVSAVPSGDPLIGQWGYPHGGTWHVWGGYYYNETDDVYQSVVVPSGATGSLTYWYWIDSVESRCNRDYARVRIDGADVNVYGLCAANNTGGYVQGAIDMSPYADGGSHEVRFRVTTNGTNRSNFLIDDVVMDMCTDVTPLVADYSDLDSSYGIAWHSEGTSDLQLGPTWDADLTFGLGDDDASDDGVTILNFKAGQQATVRVNVQGTPNNGRWVRLWFDWDENGVFDDDELEYDNTVNDGDNDILVDVPGGLPQPVYYRVRLYDSAGAPLALDPNSYGGVDDGEVEDGQSPSPTAVRLASFEASPVAGGVLLTWETESEFENLGFNLYRSTTPDGLGERLNEDLIPSQAPGEGMGASYAFLDETAETGVTYYYILEDVDWAGQRTQHGPVVLALWRAYLPLAWR